MTSFRTVREIHDLVYEGYDDFLFRFAGQSEPVVIYADSGYTQVCSDQVYTFKTWEEMLKATVFYGKTLEEALPLISFERE